MSFFDANSSLAGEIRNLTKFSNSSSTFLSPSVYILHKRSLTIWVAIVLTTNFTGAFINGVTFIATLTYRPLRISSSYLLLAHCIAIDFLISLCIGPGLVMVTYFGSSPLPAIFCRIWGALVWGSIYTSNWSHAILAINRFIAAVFPHYYSYLTRRSMLIFFVVFPWVTSIVLNGFMVGEFHVRFDQVKPWTSCTPGPVLYKPLNALVAFGVYIPCCITGVGYVLVLVMSKLAVLKRENDLSNRSALHKRYEISKMLFLSFIWNSFTNFVVPIAATFYPAAYSTQPIMQLALKGFQYTSSAINPLFFIAVSVNYRRGTAAVIQCHCLQRTPKISVAEPVEMMAKKTSPRTKSYSISGNRVKNVSVTEGVSSVRNGRVLVILN